jgi:hypothetical protein
MNKWCLVFTCVHLSCCDFKSSRLQPASYALARFCGLGKLRSTVGLLKFTLPVLSPIYWGFASCLQRHKFSVHQNLQVLCCWRELPIQNYWFTVCNWDYIHENCLQISVFRKCLINKRAALWICIFLCLYIQRTNFVKWPLGRPRQQVR